MSNENPQPTPQPQPAPGPTLKSRLSNMVERWLPAVVLVGGLVVYDQFFRPHPAPYQPPLAVAAKQYRDTLPDAYHTTAEQVKASVLADKTSIINALAAHAKPLSAALDAAFLPLADTQSGKITNVPAAADVLEQVSKALK